MQHRDRPYDRVKRLMDATLASLVLVVFAPAIALIALLIWLSMGRPVFFRQERPGRRGVVFVLVKFRTMRTVDDRRGLITDADRITRLGRWLRSTSLDELPTLWNVVRGDMSLVGPRPLLVAYLDRYTRYQARRHEVRPGLTGLAQVRGRNALSWNQKFVYDVQYVRDRSLTLDLRILLQTVGVVLGRRGISAHGNATASEFLGSRPKRRRRSGHGHRSAAGRGHQPGKSRTNAVGKQRG